MCFSTGDHHHYHDVIDDDVDDDDVDDDVDTNNVVNYDVMNIVEHAVQAPFPGEQVISHTAQLLMDIIICDQSLISDKYYQKSLISDKCYQKSLISDNNYQKSLISDQTKVVS